MFVSHGVGEYMGRYEKLGETLAQNGILMFGHDHGVCFNLIKLPYTFPKGGYQGPQSCRTLSERRVPGSPLSPTFLAEFPLIWSPHSLMGLWVLGSPPPFLRTSSSKLLHIRSVRMPVQVHLMGPLHF